MWAIIQVAQQSREIAWAKGKGKNVWESGKKSAPGPLSWLLLPSVGTGKCCGPWWWAHTVTGALQDLRQESVCPQWDWHGPACLRCCQSSPSLGEGQAWLLYLLQTEAALLPWSSPTSSSTFPLSFLSCCLIWPTRKGLPLISHGTSFPFLC